jgi:hypothetical protein
MRLKEMRATSVLTSVVVSLAGQTRGICLTKTHNAVLKVGGWPGTLMGSPRMEFKCSYCHLSRIGEKGNAYRILVRKSEEKRPLGRPRRRWVDNIKMDLRDTRWGVMDWIDLAQDRDQYRALVNMVINLRVP